MRIRCVISGSVAPASMGSSTSRSLGVRWVSAAIFPTASTVRVVQGLSDCAPRSSVQEGGARPYARYMGAGTYLRRGHGPVLKSMASGTVSYPIFGARPSLGPCFDGGRPSMPCKCPQGAARCPPRRSKSACPQIERAAPFNAALKSVPAPPFFLRQGRRGHKMLLPVRFLPVRPFAELFVEHGKTTSRKRPHDTRRSGKCARRDTFGSAPPGKGICR